MARSLPPKPNIDQLRIQAKDLVKSHRVGDASVCDTLRRLNRFSTSSDAEILAGKTTLTEAQFAIALDYGYPSWDALKKQVEGNSKNLSWIHFSEDARKAIYYAQESAKLVGRSQVDLADLIAGINREPVSPGAVILGVIDRVNPIDPADMVYEGNSATAGSDLTLTPRVKRSIDCAYEEVGIFGHKFVGAQHLALGIFRVLAQTAHDIKPAEERLVFARQLVSRQPADPAQMTNAFDYQRQLDGAGGDVQLLLVRRVVAQIRKNQTREVIVKREEDGISASIHTDGAGFSFIEDDSATMVQLVEVAQTHLDAAVDYLAKEKVPDGAKRLKLLVVEPDEARPDVVLHWRFEEVDDEA